MHRLIAEGTLEDRIAALLEKKRELADAVVGSGEGWVAELSDDELTDLVSLRAAGSPGRLAGRRPVRPGGDEPG